MRPAIIFPDIEIWLPSYLREHLAGVYVGRDYPKTARDQVVTVRRQGGTRKNLVTETARVGVNVYAANDQEANALALLVRALIEASADTWQIEDTSVMGQTEIKDDTNQARRYFTADIVVRGTALTNQGGAD